MDARENLIEDEERMAELVRSARRVAVLGIRSDAHSDRPAHYVPAYLAAAGLEVVPVPVYDPEAVTILGLPVERDLRRVKGPVDIVDVFRRPADIPRHVDDLLALRPRAVWFQSGIRHEASALRLAEAGILVVQDRCLMVEHRRHAARR